MRRLSSALARFRRDDSGAFAIIFAVVLIAVVALAGAAVDFTSVQQGRTRAQTALDAAALALQPKIYDASVTNEQIRKLAEDLLIQQIADGSITAKVSSAVKDKDNGTLNLQAVITVPTPFVSLVGVKTLTAQLVSETKRGSSDIEVALALDVTGSMAGQRITDLKAAAKDLISIVVKDAQTPSYSKLAIVPYSNSVNVGSYANSVRGAIVPAASITGAAWANTSAISISAASRANPVVITTSSNHGMVTGDTVYIRGVSGMTQINNRIYTITKVSNTRFSLNGVNGSGYNSYSSGGTVRRCILSTCEVVITTAAAHVFTEDSIARLSSLGGMTSLNNNLYVTGLISSTQFRLKRTVAINETYTSGGQADCTWDTCPYNHFVNADGGTQTLSVSTCVSERTSDPFLDTAPSTYPLGRVYPAGNNPCLGPTIVPLTSDKTTLNNAVDALTTSGSTAGHIGLAWGWYMISPQFASLWPSGRQPAAYGTKNLVKAVVLMTDGDFNTTYCKGVVSADSTSGSGNSWDHINCNAPNGNAFAQTASLCTNIKSTGTMLYAVGFGVSESSSVWSALKSCATDPSYAYLASSGADLKQVFKAIAENLSALRLTK